MSALAKLKSKVPDVVAEYFSLLKDAATKQEKEAYSVVKIQAHARGFLIRRRIKRLTHTASTIQRYWRGYLGRLRAKLARDEQQKKLRKAYFDAHATVIQRWFRGFWSRRHVHSYYARQAYLSAVQQKNTMVRAELAAEEARMRRLQQELAEQAAKSLFESKMGRLHHLVSTVSQPGIFNAPLANATGTLPTIAGAPVEAHLKGSMQQRVKSPKLPPLKSSQSLSETGNGQQASTVGGLPVINPKLTLRQSITYDMVHEAEMFEHKLHKSQLLLHHPEPFLSTLVPADRPMEIQSIRNCELYRELFDPTVGNKTETFTPNQQRISKSPFKKFVYKQGLFDKNLPDAY